jgi:hypothetical protein
MKLEYTWLGLAFGLALTACTAQEGAEKPDKYLVCTKGEVVTMESSPAKFIRQDSETGKWELLDTQWNLIGSYNQNLGEYCEVKNYQ